MTITMRHLEQDRAMRDSALRLFKQDLTLVRADLSDRGPGARAADRVGDAALDLFEESVDYAEQHRKQVAAVVGALVAFFLRGPILDALGALVGVRHRDDDRHEDHHADHHEGH